MPSISTPPGYWRGLAEGRLLAELDHPGLVRIFDIGVHEGRQYLVLEHVPGRNLEQQIEGALPSAIPAEILKVEEIMKNIERDLLLHYDGVTALAFPHFPADEEDD